MTDVEKAPARRLGARFRLVALLGLGVLLLGGAAAIPVLSGRTESPRFSLEAAQKAVLAARTAGASRWARQALLESEAALKAAMLEHRRHETRFVLLRNFAAARTGLHIAEEKARLAAALATKNHDDARKDALEAIGDASVAVEVAESYASAMHLAGKRALLQRSKSALAEARNLLEANEPVKARERARVSSRQAEDVRAVAVSLAARYTDPEGVRMWRRWVDQTIADSRRSGGSAIVVYKENHRLTLYDAGRPVRSYPAEMGYNMMSAKLRAGDGVTPEGRYRITSKKGVGRSTYHMALLLDYPNGEDRARFEHARRRGAIPRGASPGGLIEIHGDGGVGKDWTKGCVALTNPNMDDLFARVAVGTPVTIVGTDGRGGVFTKMVRDASTGGSAGAR